MQRFFWMIGVLCFYGLGAANAQSISLREALYIAKTQNPNLKTELYQIKAAQARQHHCRITA